MDARAVRRWLLIGVAIVAALGLAAELANTYYEGALVEALVPKLSLSYEANLPTWFSSSLLLSCGLAAGAVARRRPPFRRRWWGLAIGFFYASLDEAAEIHENLGGHFDTSGVLYFDWIIPAIVILAVLAAIYLPFVWSLPHPTRLRLIVAGVIYVGGALVMELPLGWWTEHAGPDTLGYALIDWVEETMEMLGASLGLVALIAHRKDLA